MPDLGWRNQCIATVAVVLYLTSLSLDQTRRHPHPFMSGNAMQRIHIDIVDPLPRSQRGNMYLLTMQCGFMKWAEVYAILNQVAKHVQGYWGRTGSVDMVHKTVIGEETLSPRCLRKCAICLRLTKCGQQRTAQRAMDRWGQMMKFPVRLLMCQASTSISFTWLIWFQSKKRNTVVNVIWK